MVAGPTGLRGQTARRTAGGGSRPGPGLAITRSQTPTVTAVPAPSPIAKFAETPRTLVPKPASSPVVKVTCCSWVVIEVEVRSSNCKELPDLRISQLYNSEVVLIVKGVHQL